MNEAATAKLLEPYFSLIFERKPKSVTALDVAGLTSYADVLIIIEAKSNRQALALTEHIITNLNRQKIRTIGIEGTKDGDWVLINLGDVIIHVFESETKTFYDIEGLWSDAPRLDLSAWQNSFS